MEVELCYIFIYSYGHVFWIMFTYLNWSEQSACSMRRRTIISTITTVTSLPHLGNNCKAYKVGWDFTVPPEKEQDMLCFSFQLFMVGFCCRGGVKISLKLIFPVLIKFERKNLFLTFFRRVTVFWRGREVLTPFFSILNLLIRLKLGNTPNLTFLSHLEVT